MGILLKSVFAGLPQTVGDKEALHLMDREWTSAIFKEQVHGPVWVSGTGLAGDGQADTKHHGGPEKAVFAYSYENYAYWQKKLGVSEITSGGMGENFVMEHVMEGGISIGDTFQIGEAIVQISQPRQPCWKPARRFRVKTLALLLQNTGRTGWYFRVLKEGHVEEGQIFTLIDRPFPQWTILKVNEMIHAKKPDLALMGELAGCELLAPKLRETLEKRIANGGASDIQKRVFGPNE
ncbi:MOSC domain-containing protein [Neobacillus mesonae]|uniref:MOSC domain-containing protein n=1 Tax=Neobacillus mesonae TaxID=1193713 RepID=UPI00203A53E6|nr:MOSC domain-containing protein [Neobacillus mesonae]MCM3570520.1 MOSC domain-containing protein [Neobacillus mesonae]